MTAASVILRPVSFIFDPVPRVDRRPRPIDVTGDVSYPDDWLPRGTVDWSRLATARDRNPVSQPPLFNWATQHAWPADGWGPA